MAEPMEWPQFCKVCNRMTPFRSGVGGDQFCTVCNPSSRGTNSAPPQEWDDFCDACGKDTPFRVASNGEWFCTVCGTRYAPTQADQAPAPAQTTRDRPRYTGPDHAGRQRSSWKPIVLGLIALVVIYGAGQVFSSAGTSASCGPFLAQCSITLTNNSFWPERIDAGSIVVDGKQAQASGSGIAWPFGSGTVLLYGADGRGLTTMNTVSFKAGPVLGIETASDMTMQSANPGADSQPTAVPTADLSTLQEGDVHICMFSDYDATNVQCTSDDGSISLTAMDQARVVWPIPTSDPENASISVLQKDGTGTWQPVGTSAPNQNTATSADGTQESETIQTIFNDDIMTINSHCDATYLIEVVDENGTSLGKAPVITACG